MKSKDIIELQKRIEARAERYRARLSENANANLDDELANLSNTKGWDIVRAAVDSMIAELLEPEEFDGDAVSYAISTESRRLTIHALRSIIGSVDSAVAARKGNKGISE